MTEQRVICRKHTRTGTALGVAYQNECQEPTVKVRWHNGETELVPTKDLVFDWESENEADCEQQPNPESRTQTAQRYLAEDPLLRGYYQRWQAHVAGQRAGGGVVCAGWPGAE